MGLLEASQRWHAKWFSGKVLIAVLLLVTVSAENSSSQSNDTVGVDTNAKSMKFGWRIIVGSIVGFLGSAFGNIGGIGGGGIFVPMLTLIIGFDTKSAIAISKFMITGGATATVFYNLSQRHPTLDLPVIDYDLALLFQPMLMLGISIGVDFNVIFPEWMLTVLLIILFVGLSIKSFLKGVETWKQETIMKKEARKNSRIDGEWFNTISILHFCIYKCLSEMLCYFLIFSDIATAKDAAHYIQTEDPVKEDTKELKKKVSMVDNIRWKDLGHLFAVWIMILALEIGKNYTITCSGSYWAVNLLQIPIAVGMSSYQAMRLYKGKRSIASKGDKQPRWRVWQLILFCCCGTLAGTLAGLLGLGGGFILAPLFLGIGIPPQVASATSILAMAFSASMAVVEYYLLKRFPIHYGMYARMNEHVLSTR
ncbi:sulfite exporter TauE/SafE family protein 3-like [Vigna umbellata]|uniref:sulfite exporter TauE/SafE family protein 3-like n=1 Tax=Vigna umbellata TaxID=87088 RepID=UPI001F5F085F|nr:sulfite exporter TauE/SafE family protein 3-like [Vigna umbellata]